MIEDSIRRIQKEIRKNVDVSVLNSTRYLSIKLLENDQNTRHLLRECGNYETIIKQCEIEINKLEKEYGEKSETIITDSKYGFISGALLETCVEQKEKLIGKKRDFD
jgi:ferrous iron transport protein B